MTNQQTKKFRTKLLSWFEKNQRSLPWRENRDAYSIWISEAMLQQTQVKKVIGYFQRFMTLFPTVRALAGAELQQVLKAWEGLGYYARARNLHKAAQIIVNENNGIIPDNYAEFRKLPGVGDYIAAAAMSQAYQAQYAVVDGNVKRVIARLFQVENPVSSSSAAKIFKNFADDLIDPNSPGDFNQAMMELGATICSPRNPRCSKCPVSDLCLSFQAGQQHLFPVSSKTKTVPKYTIAVAAVEKDDKILVVQRKEDGLLGGLWEFPGGKVNTSENLETACIGEIERKTGIDIILHEKLTQVNHAYSHFKIEVHAFWGNYKSGRVRLKDHISFRWVKADELESLAFHKAVHKFLPEVRTKLFNLHEDG